MIKKNTQKINILYFGNAYCYGQAGVSYFVVYNMVVMVE